MFDDTKGDAVGDALPIVRDFVGLVEAPTWGSCWDLDGCSLAPMPLLIVGSAVETVESGAC